MDHHNDCYYKKFLVVRSTKLNFLFFKNEVNLNLFKKFKTEKFCPREQFYSAGAFAAAGFVASDRPHLPELPVCASQPQG